MVPAGRQIRVGNRDESLTCALFKKNGFWAHNFAKDSTGAQPIDIVAIRGNEAWLVDSKNIRGDDASFPFARIEPNQRSCMAYARGFANILNLGFVLWFEREMERPRFLSYDRLLSDESLGFKSANIGTLPEFEPLISPKLDKIINP